MDEVWSCCRAAAVAFGEAEAQARVVPAGAAARMRLLQLQLAAADDGGGGGERALTSAQAATVREAVRKCRETLTRLAAEHRSAHALVSRLGKAIERAFRADISAAAPRSRAFCAPHNRARVDEAIALHLHARGLDDVARTLEREARVECEARAAERARRLRRAVDALRRRDPLPALDWIAEHHHHHHNADGDRPQTQELVFKLHRLVFRNLTQTDGRVAAVEYARRHFPPFAERHKGELQRTMCLLVYESGLLPAEYVALNDDILWSDGLASFLKEASAILDYPAVSPVETAIEAGAAVVPTLLDIHEKLVQTHGNHSWDVREELPISMAETDHSVISCPILRQQTTQDNPPMRLLCGHVISKDALDRLCRNSSRLKCPYCPMDQKRSDAKVIYI